MASEQVWRLPVVDKNNKLVGVLAQADFAAGARNKAAGETSEGISNHRQAATGRNYGGRRRMDHHRAGFRH